MGRRREHEARGRSGQARHRPHRVGVHAGEQRWRNVAAKAQVPGPTPLLQDAQAEACNGQRMPRQLQYLRAGELGDIVCVSHERGEESFPGAAVPPQTVGRAVEITPGDPRSSAIQRLGIGDLGHDQFDSFAQLKPAKEPRRESERMHGRAHVVPKPGKRQFFGACASPDAGAALVYPHRQPGPGEDHRRRHAVRASPDDDRIHLIHESSLPPGDA